jgi:hypothetical protein
MRALEELPEEGKNIEANEDQVDDRKSLGANGISNGDHRLNTASSNSKLQLSHQ